MARFSAFIDACVLVPIAPCDTLLRMAAGGAFRPLWSQKVIDEALSALERIHPDLDRSRLQSRFHSMNTAFDDALVTGWEPLVESIELPDPNDRHVVAAAIVGRADIIVTENIRDFPAAVLEGFALEAIKLDDFLLDQFDLSPDATCELIEQQASSKTRPPMTPDLLLQRLGRSGAPRFSKAVGLHRASPAVK